MFLFSSHLWWACSSPVLGLIWVPMKLSLTSRSQPTGLMSEPIMAWSHSRS